MVSNSKINVRYAETDKMGIVHHSVYPIWYEIARTDYCKEAGIPYTKMEELGIMTPIIELESKYIRPAFYDDEIVIKTKIETITPARIVFSYEIYRLNDNTLINTGITTHALVGKNFKPINVKKLFPESWDTISKSLE